jgi:hypothetical protein
LAMLLPSRNRLNCAVVPQRLSLSLSLWLERYSPCSALCRRNKPELTAARLKVVVSAIVVPLNRQLR